MHNSIRSQSRTRQRVYNIAVYYFIRQRVHTNTRTHARTYPSTHARCYTHHLAGYCARAHRCHISQRWVSFLFYYYYVVCYSGSFCYLCDWIHLSVVVIRRRFISNLSFAHSSRSNATSSCSSSGSNLIEEHCARATLPDFVHFVCASFSSSFVHYFMLIYLPATSTTTAPRSNSFVLSSVSVSFPIFRLDN